ncbi:MAG TPA: hypothetical protein VLC53_01705, partial [Myxococcota bacterium]|nr:hypothetical protein [Myxococcota bacterium]
VTGGFGFTPWPHGERLTPPGGANLPIRTRVVLARSRQSSARRAADEGWLAKLHVLSVQGNEALAGFHIGTTVLDLTPETLTDLAAAALISSEVDDRPDRIPVALNLALRASDRRPDLAEAHHNAALALEQLGLFRQAAAAWRLARDTDPDAGWQSEALAGLDRTSAVTDRQARVDMMLTALHDGRPLAPDTARAADVVRELVLRHALPAWSADAPFVATVRDAAVAIAALSGDREPLDSVRHLTAECAASPARCRAATGAHQDYRAGDAAWERGRTHDAFAAFDRVRAAVPANHPLLESIDLMHARRDYYGGRFEQASTRAMAVAADAAARGHVVLEGRALWLAGLVAHERGLFEAALEHYRDARTQLAAAADHDGSTAVENLLANYYALLEDDIRTWRHLQAAVRGLVDARAARRDPVLSNGAIATAKAGLHRAALAFLEEAVAETRALGVPGPEAMALAGLAGGLSTLGRWDEADARLAEAAQRAEAVPDDDMRDIVRAVVAAAEGEALSERKPHASLAALTKAIDFYGGRDSVFDLARLLHLRGRVLLGQGRAAEAEADWLRGVESATSQYRSLHASRDRALLRAVR